MEDETEYTPQERALLVGWHLRGGDGMLIENVMSLTGLSESGARKLMCHACRLLPVYRDDQGFWQLLVMQELILPD